jgi:hypothetical protein
MKRIFPAAGVVVPTLCLLVLPFSVAAQESGTHRTASPGIRLTVNDCGLAIGDVPRVNGLRINLRDRNLDRVTGLLVGGLSGYNCVRGIQKGITIGLLNRAGTLKGIQIGLLNIAGNNPFPFRILPLLNLNLKG